MSQLKTLFQATKPYVIGMIHVKALPGTPKCSSSINSLIDQALKESEIYKQCGLDSVLVENMHDVPYVRGDMIGPEITASMARICSEVRRILPLSMSCGVQILAGGNKEAVAVAHAANLQYVRAEGFVFSHVADEGLMNSCAGELLRYRRNIGAEDVCIFTDIKKKHSSHAITSDVSLAETAKAAEFFLSDGIIITGRATGDSPDRKDFEEVRKGCSLPIIIGSGVTLKNLEDYIAADAVIIGSHFKKNEDWRNEVDKDRVQKFMDVLHEKRKKS